MAAPKGINPFADIPIVTRRGIGDSTIPSLDVQQTTFLDSLRSIIEKHYTPQQKVSDLQTGVIMKIVKNPAEFDYDSAQMSELQTYKNPNNIPLRYKVFVLGEAGSFRSPPSGFDDMEQINLLSDYWTTIPQPLAVGDIVEVNIKTRCIEKTFNKTINTDGSKDANGQPITENSAGVAFENGSKSDIFIPQNQKPASKELSKSTFDNLYVDPPLKGQSCEKNPEKYKSIIDQFSVTTNVRYLPIPPNPRPARAPEGRYTWCNIFGWDVSMAMGCRIYPHFYSSKKQKIKGIELEEGQPVNNNFKLEFAGKEIIETNANRQTAWFKKYGTKFGWKILSGPEEAQKYANEGRLVIASWENINKDEAVGGYAGSGHVIVIRPDDSKTYNPKRGPRISQAGAVNVADGYFINGVGDKGMKTMNDYVFATPKCQDE